MQDKIPNHAPIPTELNIAPRGKSWLHGQLIDGEHGYPTRQSMENSERAAFEKWASFFGTLDVERDDDPSFSTTGYTDITVNVAWLAWQARAALAATPAAAPADHEDFAWLVVQEACETEPADEDDPECIRILRLDLKAAVLAAFLRGDATPAAAAPVVLPEPDAVISEVMGLMDEWGMESHLRGEAELDAQHSEATQEEIDCAKDRASKERAAWKAIESKLRSLLAGVSAPAAVGEPVAWLYTHKLGGAQAFTTEPPPGLKAQCQPLYTAPQAQADARDAESDYQRGYRHGYNRRDAEVQGALL